MTSARVRIEKSILVKLKERYEKQVYDEHKIIPTESQVVTIGLLELEAYKLNREVDIKFKKNGKMIYEIK